MRKTLKESEFYEIDNKGNIYNKKTGIKLRIGSEQVCLKVTEGKRKVFRTKNVLANNLIPNPNNYKKIVQIDSDKNNYNPSNLMWAETVYGNPIFDKKTDKYIRGKMNCIIRNCHGRITKGKQLTVYKQYKDKGIKVCEEWHDTLNFLKWSKSNGYFKGAWLYRYDKTKDYNPDNCFWGQPNLMKLNCEMVSDIKERIEHSSPKIIANKYQISSERVRQIKRGATLKNCK